jgi:hypothetical protein
VENFPIVHSVRAGFRVIQRQQSGMPTPRLPIPVLLCIFLNDACRLRQGVTICRMTVSAARLLPRTFLESIKSRMPQICRAFPAFLFAWAGRLEFNSRGGVALIGAIPPG